MVVTYKGHLLPFLCFYAPTGQQTPAGMGYVYGSILVSVDKYMPCSIDVSLMTITQSL